MARLEADAIRRGGVRFMNQYLVPLVPRRTLDAVKGKRRTADYRRLVQEILREPAMNLRAPSPEGGGAPNPDGGEPSRRDDEEITDLPPLNYTGEIRSALEDLVGGVDWTQTGYEGARLCDIACRALGGENVSEAILAWLRDVLPAKRGNPRPPARDLDGTRSATNKAKRRAEYARAQELFRRDPKAFAARIFSGNGQDASRPKGSPEFVRFWRRIFEGESPERDEHIGMAAGAHEEEGRRGLWSPISVEEVARTRVRRGTASGPDGIAVVDWNNVPPAIAALLFNIFMWIGQVPDSLSETRTVFLQKTDEPQTPADYRPISIGSVVVRHFHRLLASRLVAIPDLLSDFQRAFLSGVDGIADNLSVLDTILTEARRKCRSLHLASLDVSKAFDTVSHMAIVEACEGAGLPRPFVEYVRSLYGSATTLLELGRRSVRINVKRGVRQGDPLSPLLFNLVLDRALKRLLTDVGFRLGTSCITALAFADDVILCGTTSWGLQRNLEIFEEELRRSGLSLNPGKSKCVSLVASGREKKVKLVMTPTFRASGSWLSQVDGTTFWKYLGLQFRGCGMAGCGSDDVAECLERLTRAPLKPQQRMHLLRVFLLPRFYHVWTFGRLNAGILRRLDIRVRNAIRTWLRLPHDVPVGYFHAPTNAGGLGIPQLSRFIPLLRLKRFERLAHSSVESVRECARTDTAVAKVRWCRERLADVVDRVADGTQSLREFWTRELYRSMDGRALRESVRETPSTQWLRCCTRVIPARDWLNYISVHINALPSRVRTSRGRRDGVDVTCRGGCLTAETPAHCIQVCHRTHGGRVLRHDAIAKALSVHLTQRGWSVRREVSYQTVVGVRRPDIVASRGREIAVVDVQVVAPNPSLDSAHRKKVAKYRDEAQLATCLVRGASVQPRRRAEEETQVRFASATISWRGVWSSESARSLRELGLTDRELAQYSTYALRGSWMNWVRFGASTSIRMGRGRP
jgi:hypothetical protein